VIEALQFRLQATGQKKLDGETSTLKLAKNPASVDVRQPELVPDEFLRRSMTMPESMWKHISDCLDEVGSRRRNDFDAFIDASKPEPVKADIAKALKAGAGVPGCERITDKVRLVVE
jgi:hypothetical protein